MFKNIYLSLAISIGLLAGVLTALCYGLPAFGIGSVENVWPFIVPPAFISWALYFAHGKGKTSFWKTGVCNTIGVLVAVGITIINAVLMGFGLPLWAALGIAVVIGGGWMAFEATWDKLDFVPAAFCGAATTFALGWAGAFDTNWGLILVVVGAFWVGCVCAFISEKWGLAMMAKSKEA